MLFQSCLPRLTGRDSFHGNDEDFISSKSSSCETIRSVLKMDPSNGALQTPTYTQISRADHCPLLKHAWAQDWDQVVKICEKQPWRTLHMTKYSKRTALHLATFDRRCPLKVARALLEANRQMIVVRDSNNYTPLHIVAFFSAAATIRAADSEQSTAVSSSVNNDTRGLAVATNRMGRTIEGGHQTPNNFTTQSAAAFCSSAVNGEEEHTKTQNESETTSVISLFCDTAIMVEQELGRAQGNNQEEKNHLMEGTSPLYLAAKKGAPLSILKVLLQTRSRIHWIAPSTGGEPYWYTSRNNHHPREKRNIAQTDDTHETTHRLKEEEQQQRSETSFSSPLEILLREDRLRSSMNTASYYKNDAYLLGEEEDGNLLRRGRRASSGSGSRNNASLMRAPTHQRIRRSALHPDEILGVPHLQQEMRKIAIDRCREQYCRSHSTTAATRKEDVTNSSQIRFTEYQNKCLELWKKCVELLVTAGGDGIPLLSIENEEDSADVPYGILHACVCCKVPVPSLVEIALILFPEQASKRDARFGMTPLHHVLRAQHKYSYATSNLLSILLTGRASVSSNNSRITCGPLTRRVRELQGQKQSMGVAVFDKTRMPELPSLSNINFQGNIHNIEDKDRYLQSTVLLPFPPSEFNNGTSDSNKPQQVTVDQKGPIPLIFAIRMGLAMEGLIYKLLEADSHESLRTPDPLTQLPPFALVATRVPSCDQKHKQDPNRGKLRSSYAATASTTSRSSGENSNDIITTAIGSTINALYSLDESNEGHSTKPHSSTSLPPESSEISISRRSSLKDDNLMPVYKLDDIYRILLAHPQVLAQYTNHQQ